MTLFRAAVFAGLTCAAAFACAIPQMLIVSMGPDGKADLGPSSSVANYLAVNMDEIGRVNPIVWGMTDPVFRGAVLDGKLKNTPNEPTMKQVLVAADQLDAEYVLTYVLKPSLTGLKAAVELRDRGREIWKDEEAVKVSLNGSYADEDSGRSVARTVGLKLASGPLKDLKAQPKTLTPAASPGQAPIQPAAAPPPPKPDTASERDAISKLLGSGKVPDAIIALRKAIDQNPLDGDLRSMLAGALMTRGEPESAAEEAERGAHLVKDSDGLWAMAARGWLAAGKPDKARADVNEAVARDPEAASSRLLLSEIALSQLDAAKALEHADHVIQSKPSADAYFLRALARTLLGGSDGAAADYAKMRELEPSPTPDRLADRYSLATRILGSAFDNRTATVLTVMQQALAHPDAAGLRDSVTTLSRINKSCLDMIQLIDVPAARSPARLKQVLACNLLAQSLVGIETFLGSKSEDDMTEARINLGEAIKQHKAATEEDKSGPETPGKDGKSGSG